MNATTLDQGPIIDVVITLDENQEPKVAYFQEGQIVTGNVVVTCGEDITYQLVNSAGYSFMGAGFVTPFDNIIDSVRISADGQQLTLVDEDSIPGTTKFQLIFTNSVNSLLLLSPDPQVINKDKPPTYSK